MRVLQLLTLSLAVTTLAPAQNPAADTPAAAADLVLVPTVVRDKKDAIVPNLTKSDFTLKVGDAVQAITFFGHADDVPLTLGLLVDTSQSQSSALEDERSATPAFLDKLLAPATSTRVADKAFLVQFNHQVELLQDVTDSRPRLQYGLKQLATDTNPAAPPTFQPTANTPTNPNDSGTLTHGITALYDAIYLATDEITSKQKGRRVLILFSNGIDRNSKESLASAIESAQRADTVLYAVYVKGQDSPARHDNYDNTQNRRSSYPGSGYPGGGYPGGGGYPNGGNNPNSPGGSQQPTNAPHTDNHTPYVDGEAVLEKLCGETGGRVFELSRRDPLDSIYAQIAEDLHGQYRLGFVPTEAAAKDGYHRIDVTVTGPEARNKPLLQFRDGYYIGN